MPAREGYVVTPGYYQYDQERTPTLGIRAPYRPARRGEQQGGNWTGATRPIVVPIRSSLIRDGYSAARRGGAHTAQPQKGLIQDPAVTRRGLLRSVLHGTRKNRNKAPLKRAVGLTLEILDAYSRRDRLRPSSRRRGYSSVERVSK
jgi:hypothetical protein